MTNQRLQELTQKIYEEGIQKAKEQAQEIVNDAQAEANTILEEAKEKAQGIIESAREEAQRTSKQTLQDLEKALQQSLQVGKRQLAEVVTMQLVSKELNGTFDDVEFVKKLIDDMVQHWLTQSDTTLQVQFDLPEAWTSEMTDFFSQKLQIALEQGLTFQFDKNLEGEFLLQKHADGYRLHFSDAQFIQFFTSFLRPKTRQLLFSE